MPHAVLPSVEAIVAADPGRYVDFQRIRLDPAKAGEARATLRIVIEDKARSFALAQRHGVAEFHADAAARGLKCGAAHAERRAEVERIWSWFDAAPAAPR